MQQDSPFRLRYVSCMLAAIFKPDKITDKDFLKIWVVRYSSAEINGDVSLKIVIPNDEKRHKRHNR